MASTPGHKIRVLSYNIHKGFGFANLRYLLDEIRQSIRSVNADLVFLQEVVGQNKKFHKKIDQWAPRQFEFLADEIWPHYAYGQNAIYSHGHHGNAILSQYPFVYYSNIDISIIPTSSRGILCGGTDNGLQVFCLHLGLFEFERRKQVSRLQNLLNERISPTAPTIIAGDFNDWRGGAHRILSHSCGLKEAFCEKNDRRARTYPSRFPVFPMDRIYYKNLELLDVALLSGPPWSRLSDHCALYAEFSL